MTWINKSVYDAYRKYRKLTNSPSNINTRTRFYKFLGIDQKAGTYPVVFYKGTLPSGAEKKIEWLNGPYADVMFKIWEARNE